MVSISIRFDANTTIAAMNKIANTSIQEGVNSALDIIGDKVIEGAQQDVRVDTGELRDSIRVLERGQDSITIGTDNDHAEPNEFGTSRMSAQPFIGPQADRMDSEGPRILGEEIEKRIQK